MLQSESCIVNQFSPSRSRLLGCCHFLENENVELQDLENALYASCGEHISGRELLVLQDSSEVNLNHLLGKLRLQDPEIRPLTDSNSTVFFLHPSMFLDAENGFPLGFCWLSLWNRHFGQADKVARNYGRLPIEDKEYYRWLESAEQGKEVLSLSQQVTWIADRESDIYEYLARIPDEKTHLLVRISHNRCLANQDLKLFEYLSAQSPVAEMQIEIKGNKVRRNRQAVLELRYAPVTLQKPSNKKTTKDAQQLSLWAIEVREDLKTVPQGEEAICW